MQTHPGAASLLLAGRRARFVTADCLREISSISLVGLCGASHGLVLLSHKSGEMQPGQTDPAAGRIVCAQRVTLDVCASYAGPSVMGLSGRKAL